MEIKDHILFDGCKPVAFRATPNVGGALAAQYVVMHYDAATNATSAINWMTDKASKVSAHLHISRDGVVTQLAPFNRVCWHAGKSSWKGLTGLNSYAIGIELQNDGRQPFTAVQLEVAKSVCRALVAGYGIKEIVGHSEIAPGRKPDPGPLFPMADFKALV